MSDPSRKAKGEPGYETRDVNIKAITISVLILAAVVVLSFLGMRWLFVAHDQPSEPSQTLDSTLMEDNPLPPKPWLRVNGAMELAELRAEEERVLNRYVWVNRRDGVVAIPIDRAIAIVAESGLPTWPAPASPPGKPPAVKQEGTP